MLRCHFIAPAVAWSLLAVGLHADDTAPNDSATNEQVSFHSDVVPIFARSCIRCHSGKEASGGLKFETRESLLAGGDSGKAIVVGKANDSLLIQLVKGTDPDRVMPAQGTQLNDDQIATLSKWIDQGANWDDGFVLRGVQQAELALRKPTLPSADANTKHPIDRLLRGYLQDNKVANRSVVHDHRFARRASLDILGLLPPPDELDAFTRDSSPDKRAKYVDQLLGDRKSYAEHWLTFWNDALRNAYRGTGYIDGGRKQITVWLYQALVENKPYDRFVHELISPVAGSEGFIEGIKWRGVVNASQRREVQAAQNVGQVFMGTNLKCASCHDSFINHWKLKDSYGLAAVFATEPLEIHRCNKPTGEIAEVSFIYPELGSIDATKSKPERMKQLADIIVKRENGRLARTIVNRLWAHFFGRGIVEPVDDMDQEPWSQDLLDWLAADLIDHDYDLKHTMRVICTSAAYQSPAVGSPRPDAKTFVFAGPIVKRMTAEQFVDAINQLTDGGPRRAVVSLPVVKSDEATTPTIPVTAQWIWKAKSSRTSDKGGRILIRRTFQLDETPKSAYATVTCDNSFTLFVNGQKTGASANWAEPLGVNLTGILKQGTNTIAVEAVNYPDPATKQGLQFKGANPAGFIFAGAMQTEDGSWSPISSDDQWLWKDKAPRGWQNITFDTKGWQHVAELGDSRIAPWNISDKLRSGLTTLTSTSSSAGIRTALVNDDALTRALGRPNREQVTTRRDTIATTLQAIEMTNGETLDGLLKRGAKKWMHHAQTVDQLVDTLYLASIGRRPNDSERLAATALFEDKITSESTEDLLWILTMLPEFQLIY